MVGNTIVLYKDQKGLTKTPIFSHSKELEIAWTTLPAMALFLLASPSFSLLFATDKIAVPDLSIKILGHQWFWSYEVSDFLTLDLGNSKKIKSVSYLISFEDLQTFEEKGYFRILETNRRLVLPISTHVRFLISAVDVLHSWTIPSIGIKVDACPGRLNLANTFLKRYGLFYGQCSEICGVNHGFMPIVLVAVPSMKYYGFLVSLMVNN